MEISQAYEQISKGFTGSYFTGSHPPPYIEGIPYTAVIDLEDMTVVGTYLDGPEFLGQIYNAIHEANTD